MSRKSGAVQDGWAHFPTLEVLKRLRREATSKLVGLKKTDFQDWEMECFMRNLELEEDSDDQPRTA